MDVNRLEEIREDLSSGKIDNRSAMASRVVEPFLERILMYSFKKGELKMRGLDADPSYILSVNDKDAVGVYFCDNVNIQDKISSILNDSTFTNYLYSFLTNGTDYIIYRHKMTPKPSLEREMKFSLVGRPELKNIDDLKKYTRDSMAILIDQENKVNSVISSFVSSINDGQLADWIVAGFLANEAHVEYADNPGVLTETKAKLSNAFKESYGGQMSDAIRAGADAQIVDFCNKLKSAFNTMVDNEIKEFSSDAVEDKGDDTEDIPVIMEDLGTDVDESSEELATDDVITEGAFEAKDQVSEKYIEISPDIYSKYDIKSVSVFGKELAVKSWRDLVSVVYTEMYNIKRITNDTLNELRGNGVGLRVNGEEIIAGKNKYVIGSKEATEHTRFGCKIIPGVLWGTTGVTEAHNAYHYIKKLMEALNLNAEDIVLGCVPRSTK